MSSILHSSPIGVTDENTIEVFLQINTKHCLELIDYLLSHQISFQLSSPNVSAFPSKPSDERSPIKSALPPTYKSPFERIYEKYIVSGIESIPPKTKDIAEEVGMDEAYFKSQFKNLYGKPFYQLYMEKRMEYAAALLKQGYKATEVSKRIGYSENSSIKFNQMFQKHFGMTPKKYQISQKSL